MYELQSGFRSTYSTDTCFYTPFRLHKSNTAKGLFTGMILLDLQKAFDTVDHEILLGKLDLIGVRTLSWFRSYLSNRKQLVTCNGVFSEIKQITCGVPQMTFNVVLTKAAKFYFMQMILLSLTPTEIPRLLLKNFQIC
jgi:hypothetical protein